MEIARERLAKAQDQTELAFDEFDTIEDEAAELLGKFTGRLSLAKLKSLSIEAANSLRECNISLNGLTHLSLPIAQMKCFSGTEDLDQFTTIDADAVRYIFTPTSEDWFAISLNGLIDVPDRLFCDVDWSPFKYMHDGGESNASLSLNGLTTLSPILALELSQFCGNLTLNSLKDFSDEAADNWIKRQETIEHQVFCISSSLSLNGLERISTTAFRRLCRDEICLSVNEQTLEFIDNDHADEAWDEYDAHVERGDQIREACCWLRGHIGGEWLGKWDYDTLTMEAASILNCTKGLDFVFRNLDVLDEDLAGALVRQGLSGWCESISFPSLTVISAAAAYALVQNSRCFKLSLNALKELPDEVAEILSQHFGPLSLKGLAQLSDAAAESLSKHCCIDEDEDGGFQLGDQTLVSVRGWRFLRKHPSFCGDDEREGSDEIEQ